MPRRETKGLDRYAIFVDAGYVYAAGGILVLDTGNRNQIELDPLRFTDLIRQIITMEFPHAGDFLRVYWYDAAPRGVPQPEHETIASMSGMKVRLGRLTRQGQKGVDSLVVRDMMRLSSEHAICTAFLIAGDEDLRQGVIEAQDFGVKVTLIGIEPTFGENQAKSLIEEADDVRLLHFHELESVISPPTTGSRPIVLDDSFDAFAIGLRLGEDMRQRSLPDAVDEDNRIPPALDSELIQTLLEIGDLPTAVHLPASVLSLARDGLRTGLRATPDVVGPERQGSEQTVPLPQAEPRSGIARDEFEEALPSTPDGLADDQVFPFREGMEFGRTWLDEQPQDEARYVRQNFPTLPPDVDSELLRRVVRSMGLPPGERIGDSERKAARAGFWQTLGMELDFGGGRNRPVDVEPIRETDPLEFGREFARRWAERASTREIQGAQNLIEKRIGLPSDVDGALLRLAKDVFGDPVPVEVRHRLRDGFGRELQRF